MHRCSFTGARNKRRRRTSLPACPSTMPKASAIIHAIPPCTILVTCARHVGSAHRTEASQLGFQAPLQRRHAQAQGSATMFFRTSLAEQPLHVNNRQQQKRKLRDRRQVRSPGRVASESPSSGPCSSMGGSPHSPLRLGDALSSSAAMRECEGSVSLSENATPLLSYGSGGETVVVHQARRPLSSMNRLAEQVQQRKQQCRRAGSLAEISRTKTVFAAEQGGDVPVSAAEPTPPISAAASAVATAAVVATTTVRGSELLHARGKAEPWILERRQRERNPEDQKIQISQTGARPPLVRTPPLSAASLSGKSTRMTTEDLTNALADCVQKGNWRRAIALFNDARKLQTQLEAKGRLAATDRLSKQAYDQALLAYARGNDGRAALILLREMQTGNGLGRLTPTRVSYNACLKACMDGNQRKEVPGVLLTMMKDGIIPSSSSCSVGLQACAKEGNVEDARRLISSMWASAHVRGRCARLRPTTWSYNCAMEACGRKGDWRSALDIMREMSNRDIQHNAFTYGAALEACGRGGFSREAESILKQMATAYVESAANGNGYEESQFLPSAVHCNAILNAYCRGSRLPEAVRLLELMIAGVSPAGVRRPEPESQIPQTSARSLGNSAAKMVEELSDPPDALSTIATAEALGHTPHVKCRAEVLAESNELSTEPAGIPRRSPTVERVKDDVPAENAPNPRARRRDGVLFTDPYQVWDARLPLPRPDPISFGTVINGCSRVGDADSAVQLLRRMSEEGIGGGGVVERRRHRPRPRAYEATATACTGEKDGNAHDDRIRQLWHGESRSTKVVRAGTGANVSSSPTLSPSSSRVQGIGNDPTATISRPNAHCVTAAITACGRARRPNMAVTVLREALAAEEAWCNHEGRLEADAVEDHRWLSGARVGIGRVSRGQVPLGLRPAYNAAIDACARAGMHERVRDLVEDMKERGLVPGREAFNGLMLACSTSAEAARFLAEMESSGVTPDTASFTAAISACSRGSDLPAALNFLEIMRSGQGPRVDATAYGAAAAACARGFDDKRALALLREMRADGLTPRQPMFGAVMDACARRGNWRQTLGLLKEMSASKVEPTLKHYSSAVFACAVGGNPDKGLEILSAMMEKGVSPNATCVNAAMHGFAIQREWESAMHLLRTMEVQYGCAPDAVGFNTVMAACFRAGERDQAVALFDGMRVAHPPTKDITEVAVTFGTNSRSHSHTEGVAKTCREKEAGSHQGDGPERAPVGGATLAPRPDTATFNTVIAAVASARDVGCHDLIKALFAEMRARGLKPDAYTAKALRSTGRHAPK